MASSRPAIANAPTTGSPLAPRPYLVHWRQEETADTVTLTLKPAGGGPTPRFRPGQFNMLYQFGVGEAAISISGSEAEGSRIVHTVRAAGKVTQGLSRASPGDMVGLRGPYGEGWPIDRARGHDVVIIAGGLGLPPLRPALLEILAHRDSFGRVEVIYGARTPKDLVFYEQIQTWRERHDLRFQTTVDSASRDWYGDVGVATQRLPDARFDPAQTVAFVCGPEIMMKLSAQALEQRGVAPESIFLSMERNMKCAVGFCGHCQFGPDFVCRDGPVFSYARLKPLLNLREV
ncbi:MAG TPA: FAD/NAD(P)-binding protein [Thermoplasmata archaeon]|nr:FAD/NAD(P)-binding protein [Thermoplasmata archaeon]